MKAPAVATAIEQGGLSWLRPGTSWHTHHHDLEPSRCAQEHSEVRSRRHHPSRQRRPDLTTRDPRLLPALLARLTGRRAPHKAVRRVQRHLGQHDHLTPSGSCASAGPRRRRAIGHMRCAGECRQPPPAGLKWFGRTKQARRLHPRRRLNTEHGHFGPVTPRPTTRLRANDNTTITRGPEPATGTNRYRSAPDDGCANQPERGHRSPTQIDDVRGPPDPLQTAHRRLSDGCSRPWCSASTTPGAYQLAG
jgi:hypothetical protein